MRKIAANVLFFGIIFLGATAWAAENPVFLEANAKYTAGDYKAAILLYEKILSSGKPSEAVYYNLGNAQFRAGQKGQALVAYKRAHRLDPRDKDVEWNKSVLKNALEDRIEDADDNVFFSSIQKILEYITIDEAALACGAILGLLFLVSLLNFASRESKSLTAGIGGILVFLWILSGAVFYFKWTQIKDPRLVILDQEVSARYGPSDKETKAFVLHEGAEAKVADETGDWYYIFLKNKNTGWIPKKSCEII